ncbi:MAG: diguanylate cyclase, partial [Candidatus Eremiobacteraeota bacterium]|nr:diguanylate cyclase [Candidatus Eremiobacteraeota bacterium]
MKAPVALGSQTVCPTASIGICLYPEDGLDAEDLLKNADAAMYEAKADGRNGYRPFNLAMASASSRRRELEAGLI